MTDLIPWLIGLPLGFGAAWLFQHRQTAALHLELAAQRSENKALLKANTATEANSRDNALALRTLRSREAVLQTDLTQARVQLQSSLRSRNEAISQAKMSRRRSRELEQQVSRLEADLRDAYDDVGLTQSFMGAPLDPSTCAAPVRGSVAHLGGGDHATM